MAFTIDNTEGFTSNQLDVLNEVLEMILADLPDLDPRDASDATSNAWVQNDTLNTPELLFARAKNQLTVPSIGEY